MKRFGVKKTNLRKLQRDVHKRDSQPRKKMPTAIERIFNYLFLCPSRLMLKPFYLLFDFLQLPVGQFFRHRTFLCEVLSRILFLSTTRAILRMTVSTLPTSIIFMLVFFRCWIVDVRTGLRTILLIILRAAVHFNILSISHLVLDRFVSIILQHFFRLAEESKS